MFAYSRRIHTVDFVALQRGKTLHSERFSLRYFFDITAKQSRIGVVVAKKGITAVQRNLTKRRISKDLEGLYPHIKKGYLIAVYMKGKPSKQEKSATELRLLCSKGPFWVEDIDSVAVRA